MMNTMGEGGCTTGPISIWISGELLSTVLPCALYFATDFLRRCLSTPKGNGDRTGDQSPSPTPLLREWAKSELTASSWKDALIASLNVSFSFGSGIHHRFDSVCLEFTTPRFTVYQALCDHLESLNLMTVATECFHQMMGEFGDENLHAEQTAWILSERSRTM